MLLVVALCPAFAHSQAYPDRPIRVVVPYPPGGGTDVVTRAVTQRMSAVLGQPIVIDNRAGAGGNIGTEYVAKQPADGYTLLAATGSTTINQTLSKNVTWDVSRDFVPVALFMVSQSVLIAKPGSTLTSVADLVAAAKARPGQITYASSGPGSSAHLWAELFKMRTGVDLVHVPYKGTAPALNDLVGGQVDLMFCDIAAALPHIRSGKLRALGVGSAKRIAGLPDVPTISESGVPGYEASSFVGLVAPTGTPREAIERLNAAALKVLALPEVEEQLVGLGGIPSPGTPDQFGRHIRSELEKWAMVIRTGNIRTE
jgi:tripartite-type tricarboxylate transporter receptor subunit TctC